MHFLVPHALVASTLLAALSCGESSPGPAPAVVDSASTTADAGWQALFDQTPADVRRHNSRFTNPPPQQKEIQKPRAYANSCSSCTAAEFCDREHCAEPGRGGSAYVGGTFGAQCDPDPPNPQMRALCGTYRCIDGRCQSCRTDDDCCVGFPDCTPGVVGDVVCIHWTRTGRNECWFPDAFVRAGITPP